MVLELHIWGPAFGLPSIDAECLATIAYLVRCVPVREWVLIASSDPTISPTSTLHALFLRTTQLTFVDELPAVKCGSIWTSRFRNIVDYLRKYSAGEWDLDKDLDQLQRADSIA